MTVVPIRDLGKLGCNTDWSPLDLPLTSFTFSSNARFLDNRIKRGPVYTVAGPLSLNSYPSWATSIRLLNGSTELLVPNYNGTVTRWFLSSSGNTPTEENITPTGWGNNTSDAAHTISMVNDVLYVNRPDHVPWSRANGQSLLTNLPNWNSDWRCESLRSFMGTMVAINVTKGGINYANMVKTSEFTVLGSTPSTWVADTTNSATENVLGDLRSPLVDGCVLRDRFILYAKYETWVMEYRGDNLMFNYRLLYHDRGVINQNCVADWNNTHYVFGQDDIWQHDGYSSKSISIGRVRDFIYSNMVESQKSKFFVTNVPKNGEVIFAYVSSDSFCQFPVGGTIGYPGCNRAAVYNYLYDTWYFYDLPYLTGMTNGLRFSGSSYDNQGTMTYNGITVTYNALLDDSSQFLITVGRAGGSLTPKVRLLEYPVTSLSTTVDSVANAPVFIENKQMDMDDLSKEIRGYKVFNQIWPEGYLQDTSTPITFTCGSSDSSNVPADYDHDMTFDGVTLNKLDFNSPGRFLSMKITYSGTGDFSLSGFDVDYQLFGHR